MGNRKTVPVPQAYRDAIEHDKELPSAKRNLPVIPRESELHPVWYLYQHRLTEWPDGVPKSTKVDEELAADVTVKSRKVKFDDIIDPYPCVSERHPFFLDYGEGITRNHKDTTIYRLSPEKIPVKSRKVKFDDILDPEPPPQYSELHPLLLDYGEGLFRSHNDQTVYCIPAKDIAVRSRTVKFDDILNPDPQYSELHPFLLDYGEGISRPDINVAMFSTSWESLPVKSRTVKFDDVLNPEPNHSELHPTLLDYGEGIYRRQILDDFQMAPGPKWPRAVQFKFDCSSYFFEFHPFKLHFGYNFPKLQQIPLDTYQWYVPRLSSIQFFPAEEFDEDNKFEPVTGKKVCFSSLHRSAKPAPRKIQPTVRRKSILSPQDPSQIYVTESERVLHESLVLASHLYWSLLNVSVNDEEDYRDEEMPMTAVEYLSMPPANGEDELSPMSYAPNREFLANGCPSFSRLSKVPQIDFPSKSRTETFNAEKVDVVEDKGGTMSRDEAAIEEAKECEAIVLESMYIDIEPHVHLKQSYSPQLKSSQHKKSGGTERKVLLTMEASHLNKEDIRHYLRDICEIKDICQNSVKITAVEHVGAKTLCKIVFPSGKMARKMKTRMDKIQNQTGCLALMYQEIEDSDLVNTSLKQEMDLIFEDSLTILGTHQAKQKEISSKLNKTQAKKKKLSEVNDIIAERHALQQKQQELKSQEQEFVNFMKIFQERFMKIAPTPHWKEEVAMLKKQYELETERLQAALPMYAKRSEIVQMIANNQVSILLGETGSGKSTQVTQYLYEAGLAGQKKIVCTQPRKVAATSLAKRVSTEMHSQLGDIVGYKVGMQKQFSKETCILYVTDHILLKECLHDPLLTKYSCVIIDEAHERSLNTDLLLGMIKRALIHRPELRVVITSATINPDVFVTFFNGCPVLKVSGRVFPVEVFYDDDPVDPDTNFVQRAVKKAVDVALLREPGDILVFLTTPLETEQACEKTLKLWPNDKNKLMCLALHGKTQSMDQQKVFNPTPEGKRKIVFATNSAETSVTIPGIKVVIDTGLAKEKMYDHRKNMSSLKVTKISQSSANQRKGRAGRTERGKCYRLYQEEDYDSMDVSSKPEIMKVHLGMALLTLLSFNIEDPLSFDFVEMPPREGLQKAMDVLIYLEAVGKDGKLTPLGKKLAVMSLEPRMGKLVLSGIDRGIGFESVLIASFSTMGGNMFYRGGSESNKQQADKLKVRFCNLRGDIHTMLDVYKEWSRQPENQKNKWCMNNSINAKSMRMVRESAKEIQNTLSSDLGVKIHQNFHKDENYVETAIESVILESYAMNLCVFAGHESLGYMTVTELDKLVHVHPSSALKLLAKSPRYMVYENTLTTSRAFVINITCISDKVFDEFCHRGNPPIDLDEINSRVTSPCVIPDVGTATVKKVCGPRHSTRLMLEKDLQVFFHTEMLTLETKVEQGTVSVYTLPHTKDECHKLVSRMVVKEQECLFQEEIERPLVEGCAVRAVLGHGGQTKRLLFADEFRTIHIPSVPSQYSIEELVEQFRELAIVTDYETYTIPAKDRRGLKVVFEHPEAAEEVLAMLDGKGDDSMLVPGVVGKPDLTGAKGLAAPPAQNVSLKLTWCRRPNRGIAFVKFGNRRLGSARRVMEDTSHVAIQGQLCPVKLSNKNTEELFVRNIQKMLSNNEVSSAIKESIEEQTNLRPTDVVVPNDPPQETSQSDCAQYKKYIETHIKREAPGVSGLEINMRVPNYKAVQYVAFINLKNGLDAERIQHALTNMTIMGLPVQVHMTLKSFIIVRQEIFRYIQDELEEVIEELEGDIAGFSCRGEWMKSGPGGYRIDISARSAEDLTLGRTQLVKCIEGKRIDIVKNQHLQYFRNTKKGQQFLQNVQRRCHVLTTIDQYHSVIILHGGSDEMHQATKQIMKKINLLMQSLTKVFDLKELFPAGMTKRLMGEYGLDLEGLVRDSSVEMLNLELRHHRLTVHGTTDTVENVQKLLDIHSVALTEKMKEKTEQILPDCPVCFCEVESHEMYRLEYCGHAYCESCIKSLLEHGAKDKNFPIQCAKDGCKKDIVMKDIFTLVGTLMDRLRPFITASVDCYAMTHGEELKYCITPGCSMVYRANQRDMEMCGLCQIKICTHCHSEYHPGISCELNKEMKDKFRGRSFDTYSKETWLEEDPRNRALCPTCNNGIEKNGGCLHVHCTQCKAHICWNCKATFKTGGETYDHLGGCYGAIFDLADL